MSYWCRRDPGRLCSHSLFIMASVPSDKSDDFGFRLVVGASATPFQWQFSSTWSRISVTQFVGRSGRFFLKIQVGFSWKSQSWLSGERACVERRKGSRSLRWNCENSDSVQQCHTIEMLQTFCSAWNRWWVWRMPAYSYESDIVFIVVLFSCILHNSAIYL